jgi:hypothetical protein
VGRQGGGGGGGGGAGRGDGGRGAASACNSRGRVEWKYSEVQMGLLMAGLTIKQAFMSCKQARIALLNPS